MTDNLKADPEFDAESLREKYRLEREKRLRADGLDQFIEIKGKYAHFLEDPYVEMTPREPLTDDVTVALIGAGLTGLVVGARLKQAGITDVRLIDKAGDVGGTWYWNRYPGAQCDIESYIYMPLLEETGYIPTEKYAHAPEIQEHCQRIAAHFGLYDNACLSTEITAIDWDEEASRWIIRTNRGDAMRAKFIVIGNGPLHRPKLPGIPGIENFKGHAFHTSRWDYDYTGGDGYGGLDKLKDKRVALIGTGATSVQIVPHLAKACKELFVFQRTPSTIDVRNNQPTDPEWVASLEPGWQKERMWNFTAVSHGAPVDEDLVNDSWTDLIGRIIEHTQAGKEMSPEEFGALMERMNMVKMNELRARIDEHVKDPDTAEALKPWYALFCKRPCFHDQYLRAFNEPGVQLVDTDGKGIERITEDSLVVAGVEYEVDSIIYATGFEVGTEFTRRIGYDITGRDGRKLSEYWPGRSMITLHGMHVHGFPNAFVVGARQGAATSNFTHMIEECATHLEYIIGRAVEEGVREVEATEEAVTAWNGMIEGSVAPPAIGQGECTPGYFNGEGQNSGAMSVYPQGPVVFFSLLDEWRSAGDHEGLEFRHEAQKLSK
jgi:cation diffusion facilitator CzcD-associated flavoprotein CzcO